MTGPHLAPAGRYELKYVITPEQRHALVSATQDALRPDPHGTNAIYRVSSVYFDTGDFAAYWEKIDGESIRRKYRLRFYGAAGSCQDEPGAGVGAAFMEIKHRIHNTVYKQRVRLSTQGALAILSDARQLGRLRECVDWSGSVDEAAVAEIEHSAARRQLEAKTLITYVREAWQGAIDQRLRLTFDTQGQALPPGAFALVEGCQGHRFMPADQVVMEVKFDHAIPRWIRDVLILQQLTPRRFSKYAAGVEKPAQQWMQQLRSNPSGPQLNSSRPAPLPPVELPRVEAPAILS